MLEEGGKEHLKPVTLDKIWEREEENYEKGRYDQENI